MKFRQKRQPPHSSLRPLSFPSASSALNPPPCPSVSFVSFVLNLVVRQKRQPPAQPRQWIDTDATMERLAKETVHLPERTSMPGQTHPPHAHLWPDSATVDAQSHLRL